MVKQYAARSDKRIMHFIHITFCYRSIFFIAHNVDTSSLRSIKRKPSALAASHGLVLLSLVSRAFCPSLVPVGCLSLSCYPALCTTCMHFIESRIFHALSPVLVQSRRSGSLQPLWPTFVFCSSSFALFLALFCALFLTTPRPYRCNNSTQAHSIPHL